MHDSLPYRKSNSMSFYSDMARQLWHQGNATVVPQLHHCSRHSNWRQIPLSSGQVQGYPDLDFFPLLLTTGGWPSTETTWRLRCRSPSPSPTGRPTPGSSSSRASSTSSRTTISSGVSSPDLWGVGINIKYVLFILFTCFFFPLATLAKKFPRFTRTQRVCVSMATLYLAMLTNAMW